MIVIREKYYSDGEKKGIIKKILGALGATAAVGAGAFLAAKKGWFGKSFEALSNLAAKGFGDKLANTKLAEKMPWLKKAAENLSTSSNKKYEDAYKTITANTTDNLKYENPKWYEFEKKAVNRLVDKHKDKVSESVMSGLGS